MKQTVIVTEPLHPEAPPTRQQLRSRRKRAVRARTISVQRLGRRVLEPLPSKWMDSDTERPRTRAECVDGVRPCPYVSCAHHLYIDVSPRTGSIKLNFPDLEVWELTHSCALDLADAGGMTLERVGEIMNLTRERVRQVEVKALEQLQTHVEVAELGRLD